MKILVCFGDYIMIVSLWNEYVRMSTHQ